MQPNIGFKQQLCLLTQSHYEKLHESVHLVGGTLPVFTRKCKNGEMLHAHATRRFGKTPQSLHSAPVAFDAGHKTGFRPSTVAVHNDGDVLRN